MSTISAVPSTVGAELGVAVGAVLGVAVGAVLGVAVGVVLGVVEGDFVGAFVFGPSMRLPFGLFCNIDMLRDMDIDIDVLRDIDVLVNMLVMKYSKSGGSIIIDIESGISTRDSTIDMDVPKIIFLPPIFLRTTDGPAARSSDLSSSKAPLNELLASAQNLTAWNASRRKQRVLISLLSFDIDYRMVLGREMKESSCVESFRENLSLLNVSYDNIKRLKCCTIPCNSIVNVEPDVTPMRTIKFARRLATTTQLIHQIMPYRRLSLVGITE